MSDENNNINEETNVEYFKITDLCSVNKLDQNDLFLVSHVLSSTYDSENVSFNTLTQNIKDNLSSEFAKIDHSHSLSDITDYVEPPSSYENLSVTNLSSDNLNSENIKSTSLNTYNLSANYIKECNSIDATNRRGSVPGVIVTNYLTCNDILQIGGLHVSTDAYIQCGQNTKIKDGYITSESADFNTISCGSDFIIDAVPLKEGEFVVRGQFICGNTGICYNGIAVKSDWVTDESGNDQLSNEAQIGVEGTINTFDLNIPEVLVTKPFNTFLSGDERELSIYCKTTFDNDVTGNVINLIDQTSETGTTKGLLNTNEISAKTIYTDDIIIKNFKPVDLSKAQRKTKIVTGVNLDLTLENDYPIVYFPNLTQNEYDFSSLNVSDKELEDGVYTWELICKSSNTVANITVGDSENIKYVGTDLEEGKINGEPFDANTTVVFAVRLIKYNDTNIWNINYCYKF